MIKITAIGGYLPKKLLTNDDMAKIVDTSDEWIRERSGITRRFFVQDGEMTSDLAVNAIQDAVQDTFKEQDKKTYDALIVATTTPDLTFPSTAVITQEKIKKIGIEVNFAFDIQAVCAGFVYAMANAKCLIESGIINSAIVVGADTLSKILNFEDRTTCVLFGDGAGCFALEKDETSQSKIGYTTLKSDGNQKDILKTSAGVGFNQKAGFIEMEGQSVFKHAVSKMSSSVKEIMEKTNLTADTIDYIIAHQANVRILDGVAKKLKIPEEKFIKTIDKHANTSAASIPLAMWEEKDKLKRGQNLIIEALGGGLTWGGMHIVY